MRVVIQRVENASVSISNQIYSSIERGLLILVAIESSDTIEDAKWLANKICNLRIFSDQEGKMNLNLEEVGGEILAISQFTLFAKTKKGNRPSFIKSAPPNLAIPIYDKFISKLEKICTKRVKTGKFGANMKISILNDGPVTIIIDTKNKE